jgi:hypothetical protein
VQRKVLLWVADNGGRIIISPGFKTTRLGRRRSDGAPAIASSMVVIEPLTRHGWLRREDEDGLKSPAAGWYGLTDAGREAVAPKGKWPLRRVRSLA